MQPLAVFAAEEPQEQEAPVVVVDPVEVRGKRIENVEDVKQELARRPGSNILIEEKQITESRAHQLARRVAVLAGRSVPITVRRR
jgi:hypothetical protein